MMKLKRIFPFKYANKAKSINHVAWIKELDPWKLTIYPTDALCEGYDYRPTGPIPVGGIVITFKRAQGCVKLWVYWLHVRRWTRDSRTILSTGLHTRLASQWKDCLIPDYVIIIQRQSLKNKDGDSLSLSLSHTHTHTHTHTHILYLFLSLSTAHSLI